MSKLSTTASLAHVIRRLNDLLDIPLLDGVEVLGVDLVAATSTRIPHTLGRAYRGFLVTSHAADSRQYESPPAGARHAEEIWLTSSNDDTVDLWVY